MKRDSMIEGHEGLIRDGSSGAVLSVDRDAYEAYQKRRKEALKVHQIEERVSNIEEKLDRLIDLLMKKDYQ